MLNDLSRLANVVISHNNYTLLYYICQETQAENAKIRLKAINSLHVEQTDKISPNTDHKLIKSG